MPPHRIHARRAFVLASSAAALGAPAAVLGPRPVLAQDQPAAQLAARGQAPGFYRFKVGSFTVTTVHDGFRTMPVAGFVLNAPLEEVQRVLAESFLPGDTYLNIRTATVVDTGRQLVVFDTGDGPQPAGATTGRMMENLRAAGIDPDRVTHVVISHFHGDHISGLTDAQGAAAYPNAEVVVPEAEWKFWADEGNQVRSPERQRPNFANARRRFAPYQGRVRQIADGAEAVPGVRAVAAYGHTPGHTCFHVADGDAQMMYLADTTHRPELTGRRPGFHTFFDFDPVAAEASRRPMLDRVAAERMRVTGFHFPFPATGHVAKEGEGYRFVPADWAASGV
jgi:glyoxylase-like metal-dependent hydrolase (beta-lactamase superfamily II)